MKFVIDMNFPDEIPASYIKEVADDRIIKTVKDQRDFGNDYGIMETTLYPCGNEVFLNVDFTEAFNRVNVGDSVIRALDSVLSNPVISRYNLRNCAGWEAAIDDALLSQYHQGYMNLVKLYRAIDDWFLRSKQNEFCEKFCKPDDAPGHPTTITLWHKEVSGSGCTCYVTAYVELHIEDDEQVTITKMDQIQKSSKTFTLDEAYIYINQLTFDNIMKHFLVDGSYTRKNFNVKYTQEEVARIEKAIANSAKPDMKPEEFIKEAVGRYVSLIEDNISTMEANQFIDEELDRRKEYKKKRDNSCDHKCNCDCNKKVSHESKENSDIDWSAVAGNIFGNVFSDALKLLAEMNNDKKENDKND